MQGPGHSHNRWDEIRTAELHQNFQPRPTAINVFGPGLFLWKNNMQHPSTSPPQGDSGAGSRNEAARLDQKPYQGTFIDGVIVRALPGQYDYLVHVANKTAINCVSGADMVSKIIGVKDASILTEGTPVIIYVPSRDSRWGVIMCALPTILQGKVDGNQYGPVAYSVDHEGGAAMWSEDAYREPVFDAENRNKLVANANRPLDTLPGDWLKINEHGTSIGVLGMMARLKAGGAAIDVFGLDDLVRVISNQYQHYSAMGEILINNDGGNITLEFSGSYRQPEVSGEDELGKELFTVGETSDDKHLQSRITMEEGLRTLKRRFQVFVGSLGGAFQAFLAKPDTGTETYDRESKHKGMLQASVSGSGRAILRSAGGIALMRGDRIPIPKKLKEAYDPEGDKPEDASLLLPKEPFAFSEGHPFGRNLELRDATAWYIGQAYQRFDEHEKDWHTPQESEEEIAPEDDYDVAGEENEDFTNDRHKGKKAGIFVEMDGSIIIRDAWGSEIYLRGGNIIMSCAGDVMSMPGGSDIVMAGDDAIIKARKSVDVSATENDIRLSANNGLHAYTESGGILLETNSNSPTDHFYDPDKSGEPSQSKGIVLKAVNSRIFGWGDTVHLSADREAVVEVTDRERGRISFLGGVVEAIGSAVQLTATFFDPEAEPGSADISELELQPSVATLTSRGTAMVSGKQQLLLLEDLSSAAIIWAGIDENPTERTMDAAEARADDVFRDQEWQGTYRPEDESDALNRTAIRFTHRSEKDYGTETQTEIDASSSDSSFKLYQTPWQLYSERSSKFSTAPTTQWEERAVNDTYPWPGRTNQLGNVWVKLSDEGNVDADGNSVDRNELKAFGGDFEATTLDEYLVRER